MLQLLTQIKFGLWGKSTDLKNKFIHKCLFLIVSFFPSFYISTSGLLFSQNVGQERHFKAWMVLRFPGCSVLSLKKLKKVGPADSS